MPPDVPSEVPERRRRRLAWLWIVVGCFAVYTANFRELGLADTIPATLLPARIVRHFDFVLDEFAPLLNEPSPDGRSTIREQVAWTLAIRRVDGHLRSSYPVGGPILAVPVYAIPALAGWLRTFDDYRIAGKVAASLFVALSAGFVYLALRRIVAHRAAIGFALLYALGTSTWATASQAMWQHGPALLCLSVALWSALRLEETDDGRFAALGSAASAMAVVCRPQDALAAFAISLYAGLRYLPAKGAASIARRAALSVLPAAAIGICLVLYNLRAFGTVYGGYEALYQSPAHGFRGITAQTVFTLPLMEGLSGLLVSAGKGLVFYTPVAFVAFVALPVLALARGAWLARCLLIWVVGTLYFLGKNRLWWGGTSYGPRYLTELSLPIVVTLAMVWERARDHRLARVAGGVLAAFGVAVQALGAFTWECGWHTRPGWLDYRLERVWDYDDTEVGRCAETLLKEGPKPPEFGPFAR
jgi:type IV secretory pathway VirB3-like protein